jgi:hypothetical protein
MIKFVYDDGGRFTAGFKGKNSGDCVTRAIAIATDQPYKQVYKELNDLCKEMGFHGCSSSRTGHFRKVYERYLADRGINWTPLSQIGCPSHIRVDADNLPPTGTYILRLSRHLTVWKDGALRDTHDCSRGGKRMVYGYFTVRR